MSLHINRFMDRITAAESKRQRDVVMPVADARALHTEVTRLLLLIEELRSAQSASPTDTNIIMSGGDF